MSSTLVSVIVPVYNAEKYLQECIDSILGQTYENIEILVTDDGSNDKSYCIMENYATKDSRVHIFRQENQGPNAARLNGLEHSNGEYVIFVDADDYMEPELVETLIKIANTKNYDIVLSNVKTKSLIGSYYSPEVFVEGDYSGREMSEKMIDIENFFRMNVRITFYPHLLRSSIIKPIMENFDMKISMAEDVACLMLACMDSNRVFSTSQSLYINRMNDDSLMHQHKKSYYSSMKHLYAYMMRELSIRDASNEIYRELEILIIRVLLISGYTEAFGKLDELYPFEGVKRGSRVIVYGAGAFGIELIQFFKSTNLYRLVGWLDRDWRKLSRSEEKIESPETIQNLEYDYVLIANTKDKQIEQIEDALIQLHVDGEKIKRIDLDKICYSYLPKDYKE
ncbi:glycosyltransferase [Pseudobutyrivibrio sp.]|uniref:glycosyltransferase n=1 Tax=Pseudobutyrivibrio sp. TaxID=2014367 RepID=UPI0025E07D83|nr:glycosyltransferase [Pseudobutyrivibrio sp.]MBR5648191.1 glycosyltransferase [Pseudobutyrivibrio sp.]